MAVIYSVVKEEIIEYKKVADLCESCKFAESEEGGCSCEKVEFDQGFDNVVACDCYEEQTCSCKVDSELSYKYCPHCGKKKEEK